MPCMRMRVISVVTPTGLEAHTFTSQVTRCAWGALAGARPRARDVSTWTGVRHVPAKVQSSLIQPHNLGSPAENTKYESYFITAHQW